LNKRIVYSKEFLIIDYKNLNNSHACSEWRDVLIGNKNKLKEQQMNVLNAVGSKQKDR
jgi:hypothetical protein